MMSETEQLVLTVRDLLMKGGVLQSVQGNERINDLVLARALEAHLTHVRRRQSNQPDLLSVAVETRSAIAEVLTSAKGALHRISGGASTTSLSDLEVASLQTIVEVTGRPALRYADGRVGMPPSKLADNERWAVLVATARSRIDKVSQSVGRIGFRHSAAAGQQAGTGWRLGDDLVVTNRHVARSLVADSTSTPSKWQLDIARESFIDFAVTDDARTPQQFTISGLAYCAVDTSIDFAVLRAEAGEKKLPPSLAPDWAATAIGRDVGGTDGSSVFRGEWIYVVGHPYWRSSSGLAKSVFGDADGFKRCSPGRVLRVDSATPTLEHDCSTLSGNSGSCVLTVSTHNVVGLHIGGLGVDEVSGKGRANAALAVSRLGVSREAEILRLGRV